jgi:hypothetical protein
MRAVAFVVRADASKRAERCTGVNAGDEWTDGLEDYLGGHRVVAEAAAGFETEGRKRWLAV